MHTYKFKATALCPAKENFVRDFYDCILNTDVTIPISDIAEICETFVDIKMFQELFTVRLKEKLPRGKLVVIGNHYGVRVVTDCEK